MTGRELVAEGAARRAPHDRLGAVEAHLAIAGRGDVDIGLADQQCAQVGFAQGAEELGEAAARHVDFQRFLVLTSNLELDLSRGDLVQGALQGRPFAPRAALDAVADGGEQLPRPVAQGLLDDGVGLVISQLGPQRAQHRHQDLSLYPRLVQEGYLGIHQVVVEHAGH
jgi:hypothetical protein